MKYNVISWYILEPDHEAMDNTRFIKKVQDACNDGWEPIGGINVTSRTNNQGETRYFVLSQAMIKK